MCGTTSVHALQVAAKDKNLVLFKGINPSW
jgi:hypothetical protein